MIVMKFGGSSVANRQQIEKVFRIAQSRAANRPIIVSSAHKGVTDGLVNAARAAAQGELDASKVINHQREIAESLGCPKDMLDPFFQEITDLLRGISLVQELSPRSLDYISGFGERMSVRCIADFFTRQGLQARAHDVWDLGFITNDEFGNARPIEGYEGWMRDAFAKLPSDELPVVTGFIGKTENGDRTTVGRNGSDLTATLIGAALGADEIQIWTDTDGVMTADPGVVSGAKNIPTMHFDEAAELAYFGSRVLHPSTLLPALQKEIPVRVLNTNRPEHRGTVIARNAEPNPNRVTSIAYKENQYVVTLTSTRMFGQAGFLADMFGILARHRVNVDMISTSEVSVSFTVDNRERLQKALPDLETLGNCELAEKKAILAIVGQHLSDYPGLGAKMTSALASESVNIEMISYGRSSVNISLLIDESDIGRAVPILHKTLFETAS